MLHSMHTCPSADDTPPPILTEFYYLHWSLSTWVDVAGRAAAASAGTLVWGLILGYHIHEAPSRSLPLVRAKLRGW